MGRYERYLIMIAVLYLGLLCYIYYNIDAQPYTKNRNRNYGSGRYGGDIKKHLKLNNLRLNENIGMPYFDHKNRSLLMRVATNQRGHVNVSHKKVMNRDKVINSKCVNKRVNSFRRVSNMFVYSAYYDNRRQTTRFVRLIVLRQKNMTNHLWCGFYNESNTYLVKAHSYVMCENHDMPYGGWIYSCYVPAFLAQDICSISLGANIQDFRERNAVFMNVMSIGATTPRYTFGVCVSPLFDVSVQTIVQFIELSRILGASSFTFYLNDISKHALRALRHYKRKGLAILIPWTLPRFLNESQIWYHGQLLTIQDCLYRNMNQVEFMTSVDLDEFIIPKQAHNWSTLVRDLENSAKVKPSHIAGFSFSSAFFPTTKQGSAYFKTPILRFFQRTVQFSKRRTKVIVRPDRIFELGIHHISRPIRNQYRTVSANKSQAFIHHYRSCIPDTNERQQCSVETEDRSLLKYAEDLEKNYLDALQDIRSLKYN